MSSLCHQIVWGDCASRRCRLSEELVFDSCCAAGLRDRVCGGGLGRSGGSVGCGGGLGVYVDVGRAAGGRVVDDGELLVEWLGADVEQHGLYRGGGDGEHLLPELGRGARHPGPVRELEFVLGAATMTGANKSGFYVAIAAEADQNDLVADIVYGGDHVASATRVDGEWVLIVYDIGGEGRRQLPLAGILGAVQEAAERLGVV